VPAASEAEAALHVLSIPLGPDGPDGLTERITRWLSPNGPVGYQLVSIHGADIHWHLPRIAIVVMADRAEPVCQAVLEAAYLESELRAVEAGVADLWPAAEADAPLAFEFQERNMGQRKQLAQRFQQALMLRARLAKITPRLLLPQTYPPTLASQVQERLRERLGMAHRVEALETQLEVFERIYDGCSQRANDYVLARKGLTLEWVIVVLLSIQVFLIIFELLVKARD
jgi:hypothetical protein